MEALEKFEIQNLGVIFGGRRRIIEGYSAEYDESDSGD